MATCTATCMAVPVRAMRPSVVVVAAAIAAALQVLLPPAAAPISSEKSPGPRLPPRLKLNPGMLPRPAPSPGPALHESLHDTWRELSLNLFPSASAVQCYLVRSPFAPHSHRERADAESLEAASEALARLCTKHIPGLMWSVAEGRPPATSVEYSFVHRMDRLGRYVTVLAPYTEQDGSGVQCISELLKTDLWNPKARYLLVLDTHTLPDDRRCSLGVARTVAKSLWLAKQAVVAVLLTACPWQVVLHSALEEDPDKRTVVISPHNISAMQPLVSSHFQNFHRQKWRISIYPSYPTLVEVPGEPLQHAGVDAWVMRTAARYFNFTAVIKYPEDGEAHGYSQGGTGTGTLGAVMSAGAWISFNGRFVKDYNTKEVEFTYPHAIDELCVMVPPSERIPNYITIFRVFSVAVWLILVIAFFGTAVAVYGLDWAHGAHGARRRREARVGDAFFAVYWLMLAGAVSQPHARAREASTLLLLSAGLLFSVTFMGAFQGLLFKKLTNPQYYPDIDSLEGLADSGIPITTRSQSLMDTFAFDSMRRLQDNFQLVAKNWTSDKPFSFLIRRNGAYLREENKPLHLVAECPRKFLLAYIVNRNFPYKHEMSVFLQRCMDAGLMAKWLRETYEAVPEPRGGDDMVLSLSEVEAAFFVLAIGILVSSAVLSAELLHHRVRPVQPWRPQPQDVRLRRRRPPRRNRRPPDPPPPYDGHLQRSTFAPTWAVLDVDVVDVVLTARWKFQH